MNITFREGAPLAHSLTLVALSRSRTYNTLRQVRRTRTTVCAAAKQVGDHALSSETHGEMNLIFKVNVVDKEKGAAETNSNCDNRRSNDSDTEDGRATPIRNGYLSFPPLARVRNTSRTRKALLLSISEAREAWEMEESPHLPPSVAAWSL